VDTGLFCPEEDIPTGIRFVHYVSSFKGQKNTEGLLEVFSRLLKKRDDWECILYGPADTRLLKNVQDSGLQKNIRFTGEISYSEVAGCVRKATAFVSFSNYENQPCSILEALCCGAPVIATRVGGIPEIIHSQNGILVNPGDEDGLFNAIETMVNNVQRFDRKAIAADAAAEYSYESVGKQLYSLYPVGSAG